MTYKLWRVALTPDGQVNALHYVDTSKSGWDYDTPVIVRALNELPDDADMWFLTHGANKRYYSHGEDELEVFARVATYTNSEEGRNHLQIGEGV